MTTREEFSGGTVDQLLLDAGHADVPELRAALLSIASLAQLQPPAPGPELALMLAGSRDELTRQRWLRKHRPAVVGLAVLAGMGLGVTGVAATSQVSGDGAGPWSVQQLTTDWAPGWSLPLAPEAADQNGRISWVSPLFLQLERAHAGAAPELGEPAAQSADAEAAAAEPEAPITSARENPSPTGKGRVPGATLNGNPGQSNQGKSGPGKANHGKAGVGQVLTGRAPDQADEEAAAIAPGAAEADAAETGDGAELSDGAPEYEGTDTAKSGVKLGSPVETAIDSTVDPALDAVSSWLGKFRR
ncbi:hypothetical protein [Arthrobacter oryzae]|uniref:hypothetical protein n=1 Tax=Arthrobacter oryzae TaxID=409290 RepID=UPI00285D27DA|nr:hypothetical protein [Arthrobacter oryzae]MDR6506122.1 hypothetical protein [Arthrobacter oryzae]